MSGWVVGTCVTGAAANTIPYNLVAFLAKAHPFVVLAALAPAAAAAFGALLCGACAGSGPVDPRRSARHGAGRRTRPVHATNQPPVPRRMKVVLAPDSV
jgi:hypothetical protein